MKLLVINDTGVHAYNFNKIDSDTIAARCKAAGKLWSSILQGFVINTRKNYAAITIRANDGVIESMEYIDIDSNQPEFSISDSFLNFLARKDSHTDIPLDEFEPVLREIISAPTKARRWEVYKEISEHYPSMH